MMHFSVNWASRLDKKQDQALVDEVFFFPFCEMNENV